MEYLKSFLMCSLCFTPGYTIIAYFGFSPVSALPFFWGGMLYRLWIEKYGG